MMKNYYWNPKRMLPALLLFLSSTTLVDGFNFEVGKRIVDMLNHFLGDPEGTNEFIVAYRRNGAFAHDLQAADRDDYIRLAFSLSLSLIYVGLEDGTHIGNWEGYGIYKEPGNSGFDVNDPSMQKHLKSCVNIETGEPIDCTMEPGMQYPKYSCDGSGNCNITEPCPDETSQMDCTTLTTNKNKTDCENEKKWCRKYTIETVADNETLGYIPSTHYCQDAQGRFTQELGQAYDLEGGDTVGNCSWGDGITLVNRTLAGDYAYCDGTICHNTFSGGWYSEAFDPRYRRWYTRTKELQAANWSPPYDFTTREIGITHSHPIYTPMEDGRKRFHGVLAIDYRFQEFTKFLVDSYNDTSTLVVLYEDEWPHYLIGASTNINGVGLYLTSNNTILCDDDARQTQQCDTSRIPITDLADVSPLNDILLAAFAKHNASGYKEELRTVKTSDDIDAKVYTSQSVYYEKKGANINWRIIIASPGAESTTDAITKGNSLLAPLCAIAALGFGCCALLLFAFFKNRHERQVIYADWRFTCAFILGCALLNGSSFTLLGENTDATCLMRMWSFHFFLVLALAPLLIKVYRMYRLVGSADIRRATISNLQAASWTLPIILTEVVILLVFTIVDPPTPTKDINEKDGSSRIVCESDSDACFIIQLVFEASLVLVGCVLAYMSRNLKSDFGESRQLIFAMYNIALVFTIIAIVVYFAEFDTNVQNILQAFGVFWATVVSTAAFVLPRIIQIRPGNQSQRGGVVISGVTRPQNKKITELQLTKIDRNSREESLDSQEMPKPDP